MASSNPREILVVIGFAEALSAPEVAWSLVDAGFTVIAFSRRGKRAALRKSRHVRVFDISTPEVSIATALEDLSNLLASETCRCASTRVLFPLDDASLWLCSHLPNDPAWIPAFPRRDIVGLAFDKAKQVELAKQSGFNVPPSSIASKAEDIVAAGDDLPVIIRPAFAVSEENGAFRKGQNWICNNQAELEKAVATWRRSAIPVLVQPFLDGTGEGVFGLATQNGVKAWSAHRRVRMMNPHGSGSSACISRPVEDNIKRAAEELIRRSNWQGLFMIELLRAKDGTAWFVEFNGRPWGSMALARRMGLEYPAWAVNLAVNPDYEMPPSLTTDPSPMVCRNVGRELMHFLFVVRGPKSNAIKDWPRLFPTILGLIPRGKRDSFYNVRADDLRVFISDTWITLRDNLIKSRH